MNDDLKELLKRTGNSDEVVARAAQLEVAELFSTPIRIGFVNEQERVDDTQSSGN